MFEFRFQGCHGALDTRRRDMEFTKLFKSFQREQIGKTEFFSRLDQALFFPGPQLALADVHDTANVFPTIRSG